MSTTESSWYNMMGLSKILLRNFVIGCFLLCIVTITTLASLLNKLVQERLNDSRQHGLEIADLNKKCAEALNVKTEQYILLLREAINNQKELSKEINELEKKYTNQ